MLGGGTRRWITLPHDQEVATLNQKIPNTLDTSIGCSSGVALKHCYQLRQPMQYMMKWTTAVLLTNKRTAEQYCTPVRAHPLDWERA